MHVWHRLTGHAVSFVRNTEKNKTQNKKKRKKKKRAIPLQNVIRKKEERLKQARGEQIGVRDQNCVAEKH